MAIAKLTIHGLRGFASKQELDFAIPDGTFGSGLTLLVGPNNGGKSTVVEAVRAISQTSEPSFTIGKRNQKSDDKISIVISNEKDEFRELKTVESGGSECIFSPSGRTLNDIKIFVLPSRRFFNPYFSKGIFTRDSYIAKQQSPSSRSAPLNLFSHRLFQIQKNKNNFDKILGKVLVPVPNWTIDQSDDGHYFLKYEVGGSYHNSDGLGEGLVSLFFIIDALYDSKPGNMIVIDEPELSLHPSLQKNLDLLLNKQGSRYRSV